MKCWYRIYEDFDAEKEAKSQKQTLATFQEVKAGGTESFERKGTGYCR